MPRKVYCQDCEYVAPSWTLGLLQTDDHRCKHPLLIEKKHTSYAIYTIFPKISKFNKVNNCKLFYSKKESKIK